MDRQSVFSSRLYPSSFGENEDTNLQVRSLLESFILDFRLDNSFIYRFVNHISLEDTAKSDVEAKQRSIARECAPQEVLLRRKYWRPDQVQRGDRPQACDRTRRDYTLGMASLEGAVVQLT